MPQHRGAPAGVDRLVDSDLNLQRGDLRDLARARPGAGQPSPRGAGITPSVGVSQPVVSKWESGRCAPLPVTVKRVADALGVTFTMSSVQAVS